MKRNYFIAIAVAALFIGSTVAQAADVTFSGQFRPRMNIDNDASADTKNSSFFDTRVRLNAKANVNPNTEVFLQFQSVGVWGDATNLSTGTRRSQGGGADQASDVLNDVGFHQAYLTLKNFAGYAVDAKIGRQEVVIDGHRLFGHTGWTQGAETKDAIRLTHAAGNHTLNYTFIAANEEDNASVADNVYDDDQVHVFYAQTQGVMGGKLSGIFTYTNDDSQQGTTIMDDQEHWFTIGARQAGKASGLDYRVEFYHQFGDAAAIANTAGYGQTGATATGDSIDRDAQMFGIRVGKTFKNVAWSPTVTLWYDYLSGTDDDDITDGDHGAFDTMYDTGHKFYGLQDFYLSRAGAGTQYFGLEDLAIKAKMSPKAGWTIKADLHHFRTATDISGGDADTMLTNLTDASTVINGAMDPDLGTELDLTLAHKYDANTTISAGYSHYWTTNTFGQLNCGAAGNGGTCGSNSNDGSDWTYVQIDTKF